MDIRSRSAIDRVIGFLDEALRVVSGPAPHSKRPNPAANTSETEQTVAERELAGRLMRINHSGEVCAQALYQGQAITARLANVRDKMRQAAHEENDHLAWTAERIGELGTHASYLNPLWYTGAFAIGAATGLAGDRWSLGFVAETERQVVRHLESHLARLAPQDTKNRVILEQMKQDEARHATVATEHGAAALPEPVKRVMQVASKVMTTTTYWI